MPPSEHDQYHDAEPRMNGDDEEAQLLSRPREQLEFEDTSPLRNATRPRGLCSGLVPRSPHINTIPPILPTLQNAPLRLYNRLCPTRSSKAATFVLCLSLWALAFVLLLKSQLPIQDGAGRTVINLDCVDTLWRRNNECGLDGVDCRPFSGDSFAFRCPAKCRDVQVLNPHAVGPINVNYRPLVVGDKVYRGDSFICASAIHAGIISDADGGCGQLARVADHQQFPSTSRHGIKSVSFDSYFPLSFSFSMDDDLRCAKDPRQALLLVSLFFTCILSLLSSTSLIFFPIFTLIFAHVSFASDPPSASVRNTSVLPDHVSMFVKRILPAYFIVTVLYWTVIRRTLKGLQAPVEKTVLWLGGFWFGALSNYTFDWIPISRLTAHDLEQQPGAKLALAIIILFLVCIFAQQVYSFWLEGRLPRYLGLYAIFLIGIFICLVIPGLSLRLHHYILALLLLPGTSMQTRPSLIYQGILLGLFVNGVARWDFDSVLQTTDALRADGAFDSALPTLLQPFIRSQEGGLSAAFQWRDPPAGMHGISVLVNDVERDRAFFTDDKVNSFVWERDADLDLPEYFRFGYVKDGRALDYTKAGTLFANGTWIMPSSSKG